MLVFKLSKTRTKNSFFETSGAKFHTYFYIKLLQLFKSKTIKDLDPIQQTIINSSESQNNIEIIAEKRYIIFHYIHCSTVNLTVN